MNAGLNLRTLVWTVALWTVAAVTSSGRPIVGPDPGSPDTVYVDSVSTLSPGIITVPITFANDESLASIEITLTLSSPDVFPDSFSFVGGRVEYATLRGAIVNGNTVIIYALPIGSEPLIQPGSGLLGELIFSLSASDTAQLVVIDSITIVTGEIVHSVTFSDSLANAFKPQFVRGYLDVGIGSCCTGIRGNVDFSADDVIDIVDLTYLVDFLFAGGPAPICQEEGNVDGDPLDLIDIVDLTFIIDLLFAGGVDPPLCP
ncbi:MAG: hypothetical protein ACE5FH_02145 [Candidatus Zixiibacteriota bacterium]